MGSSKTLKQQKLLYFEAARLPNKGNRRPVSIVQETERSLVSTTTFNVLYTVLAFNRHVSFSKDSLAPFAVSLFVELGVCRTVRI
jgi:hypothetical protein